MENKALKRKIFKEMSFMEKINEPHIDLTLLTNLHWWNTVKGKGKNDERMKLLDDLNDEADD